MLKASIALALCALLGAGTVIAHPGSGIVIDGEGRIFVMDTGEGVWKIDGEGRLTPLPASRFHWMTLDEAGRFATSEKSFGGWFERVTPQGAKPTLVISSDFPLTIGRDGNLYYADTRLRFARIVRRTPAGKESVLAADDAFAGIGGITAGPDGTLYVTDAIGPDAHAIRKIAMDGKVSLFAGSALIRLDQDSAVAPPPDAERSYCRGLAVDAQGVVYVAATGSRRVLKITPKGEVSTVLQAASPWSPTSVALHGGELYVVEWQDAPAGQTEERRAWIPRVRKIARDGKITTVATISR